MINDEYSDCPKCGEPEENWFDLFKNNSLIPVFRYKCNNCGILLDANGIPQIPL